MHIISISITHTIDTARDTHLREPDHANGENEGPDELDAGRDPPCRVIGAVLGRVVDDGGEEQADGDRPLVPGHNGTTDPLGRTLGLVHGDEDRDEPDTETGEDTADDEGGKVASTSLEGNTEAEDEAGDDDTDATANDVSDGGAEKSTWRNASVSQKGSLARDVTGGD